MINEMRDDVLLEILIRLPDPRSACRCKAVCKQWRSLLSERGFNRRFISHHRSQNKPPPPKLLLSDDILSFIPMSARTRSRLAIYDSFKDLLLCGFRGVGKNSKLGRSYLLCNQFTRQWIALPLAPERRVRHTTLYARLVCEPLVANSLDLGGGFEYRLRVVCMYQYVDSMKLDVFCSESGEWTKEANILDGYLSRHISDAISCNGVLYVSYATTQGVDEPLIVGFNPFHLDIPPTPIDVSPISKEPRWNILASQGALHLTVFEVGTKPAGSLCNLSVWRLNKDRLVWSKVCEGPVKSSSSDNYSLNTIIFPALLPEKPEIVYFTHLCGGGEVHLRCDLRSGGELEFVGRPTQYFTGWLVFQPKVDCWPTPIPRYHKLRVLYNGSYRSWVQSNEPIAPSITV